MSRILISVLLLLAFAGLSSAQVWPPPGTPSVRMVGPCDMGIGYGCGYVRPPAIYFPPMGGMYGGYGYGYGYGGWQTAVGSAIGTTAGVLIGGAINRSIEKNERKRAEAERIAYEAQVRESQERSRQSESQLEARVAASIEEVNRNIEKLRQETAERWTCRTFETTITIDGQPTKATGKACQQPDGSWKVVQ
jgi:surface antigen